MPQRIIIRRTLETPIERKAVALILDNLGVRSLKLQLSKDTGWPDRLFLIPGGRPLLIEFKRPGDNPKIKQEYVHDLLRSLGYAVKVVDDAEDAYEAVAEALRRARSGQPLLSGPDTLDSSFRTKEGR